MNNKKLDFIANNKIETIELFFIFTKNSIDSKMLIDNSENWPIFEPTKFMYLFQTFNMLYDNNWNNFKKNNTNNNNWGWKEIGGNEKYNKRTETWERIINLNNFINNINDNNFKILYRNALFDNEDNVNIITQFESSKNEINIDIYNERVKEYINTIKKTSNVQNWENQESVLFIEHILLYLNFVRNNLFHGSKQVDSLLKKSQINRFVFYNKLLEIYIELFFESFCKIYNYKRLTIDNLKYTLSR